MVRGLKSVSKQVETLSSKSYRLGNKIRNSRNGGITSFLKICALESVRADEQGR
jgi:hypothetical protein